MTTSRVLCVGALMTLVGCNLPMGSDSRAGALEPCEVTSQCEDMLMCVDGLCRPIVDAPVETPDASVEVHDAQVAPDASVEVHDAQVAPDASVALDAEMLVVDARVVDAAPDSELIEAAAPVSTTWSSRKRVVVPVVGEAGAANTVAMTCSGELDPAVEFDVSGAGQLCFTYCSLSDRDESEESGCRNWQRFCQYVSTMPGTWLLDKCMVAHESEINFHIDIAYVRTSMHWNEGIGIRYDVGGHQVTLERTTSNYDIGWYEDLSLGYGGYGFYLNSYCHDGNIDGFASLHEPIVFSDAHSLDDATVRMLYLEPGTERYWPEGAWPHYSYPPEVSEITALDFLSVAVVNPVDGSNTLIAVEDGRALTLDHRVTFPEGRDVGDAFHCIADGPIVDGAVTARCDVGPARCEVIP